MTTESNMGIEMTPAETHAAVDVVAEAMQAAAQTAHHTFLKELWQRAHKMVAAGGTFTTTGKPEIDDAIRECWGDWTADKPFKAAWDGQPVPERFRVPSPVAGTLGRAVVVSTGLAAGVHDKSKRPRYRQGSTISTWGWEVIDRALQVENLPAEIRELIETRPLSFTQEVWRQCVAQEGPKTGGGKVLVGSILDRLCGGAAIEPTTTRGGKGGRAKGAVIDTQADNYGDPGLRYLMGGK